MLGRRVRFRRGCASIVWRSSEGPFRFVSFRFVFFCRLLLSPRSGEREDWPPRCATTHGAAGRGCSEGVKRARVGHGVGERVEAGPEEVGAENDAMEDEDLTARLSKQDRKLGAEAVGGAALGEAEGPTRWPPRPAGTTSGSMTRKRSVGWPSRRLEGPALFQDRLRLRPSF